MSVLSGIGQLPSVNVGQGEILISSTSGGNIPTTPLVSGTQYTFVDTPFAFGTGYYLVQLNFDVTGDNTTSFKSIYTEFDTESLGVFSDNDFLVGTTLPDTDTYSFASLTPLVIQDPQILVIFFTATFTGTAPTITSPYIKLIKTASWGG
jgi:hypothetical protein